MKTRFPIARYSFARLLVLWAAIILREDDWVFDRLYWVNDSIKMSLKRLRSEP
ncbi:MAG TPA: hypothetical protein VIU82_22030 [Bosea sp. (in: a-proteobacteria)]